MILTKAFISLMLIVIVCPIPEVLSLLRTSNMRKPDISVGRKP